MGNCCFQMNKMQKINDKKQNKQIKQNKHAQVYKYAQTTQQIFQPKIEIQQPSNDKQKSCYKSIKNHQPSQEQQRFGLPNLGNTCFLNSAIQFLFASKKFRSKIFKQNNQECQLQQLVRNVFISIDTSNPKEADQDVKTAYLNGLIQYFLKSSMGYKKKSQQDCLQFLLFFLDQLKEKDQNYGKIFEIQYQQICVNKKCKQKSSKFTDFYLSHSYQTCPSCKQKCQIKFESIPQNLILLKIKQQTKHLQFQYNDDKMLNYGLSAEIIYTVEGRSGHYISKRRKLNPKKRDKDMLFYFNDIQIEQKNQFQGLMKYQTIACLYELQQCIQKHQTQLLIMKSKVKSKVDSDILSEVESQQLRKLTHSQFKRQSIKLSIISNDINDKEDNNEDNDKENDRKQQINNISQGNKIQKQLKIGNSILKKQSQSKQYINQNKDIRKSKQDEQNTKSRMQNSQKGWFSSFFDIIFGNNEQKLKTEQKKNTILYQPKNLSNMEKQTDNDKKDPSKILHDKDNTKQAKICVTTIGKQQNKEIQKQIIYERGQTHLRHLNDSDFQQDGSNQQHFKSNKYVQFKKLSQRQQKQLLSFYQNAPIKKKLPQ